MPSARTSDVHERLSVCEMSGGFEVSLGETDLLAGTTVTSVSSLADASG